jgi:hypothetical protein
MGHLNPAYCWSELCSIHIFSVNFVRDGYASFNSPSKENRKSLKMLESVAA